MCVLLGDIKLNVLSVLSVKLLATFLVRDIFNIEYNFIYNEVYNVNRATIMAEAKQFTYGRRLRLAVMQVRKSNKGCLETYLIIKRLALIQLINNN